MNMTSIPSTSIHISTPSSSITGVHTIPLRALGFDFTPGLHTAYAYVTGLLLTVIGIKYEGSGNNPFKEHPAIMKLFLIAIFVYTFVLMTLRADDMMNDKPPNMRLVVCHISGSVACELLMLVLVSPIWCFIINVASLLLVVGLCLCYQYVSQLLNNPVVAAQTSDVQSGEGQATDEMEDVQAARTSTA